MITLLLAILVPLIIYYYIYKPRQYWKNLNVPYLKPVPLFGNMFKFIRRKQAFHEWIQEMYNATNTKFVGTHTFTTPVLLFRDLNLIKTVTIKGFDHFMDHRPLISEDIDPLFGKNLFTLRGEKWRNMRSTLSPAFTSSKMRFLFVLISDCAKQFTDYFTEIVDPSKPLEIELKDTFSRFTNDVIATSAFGIQCNSIRDKDNEFYLMGKDATSSDPIHALKFFVYTISKTLARLLNIQIFSKEVRDFFRNIIKTNIASREKGGIVRPDMIHLLMQARKGQLKHDVQKDEDAGFASVDESEVGKDGRGKIDLTDDDITAQALLFFIAGFDTVSTALCFTSYELAQHPDIQERLQEEIDDALENCVGKLTYEVVMKMKYLDMVLSESLRKWPPIPALDRICTEAFTIPAEEAESVPIHIKENDVVLIPPFAIHRDPQYYSDPEKYDPERFSEENKSSINPLAYMPFGIGPRNCIGSRFALMEAKTILINMLSKFSYILTEKSQVPVVLKKGDFNLNGEKGLWVGLKRRNVN